MHVQELFRREAWTDARDGFWQHASPSHRREHPTRGDVGEEASPRLGFDRLRRLELGLYLLV